MPRMLVQEIKDHNKVNLDRCSSKQRYYALKEVPGLEYVEPNMFKSRYRFSNSHADKYVCTLILWDKETNDLYSIIQFGFSNRNRLRNRLQALQKQWDNIVCRIISINEV